MQCIDNFTNNLEYGYPTICDLQKCVDCVPGGDDCDTMEYIYKRRFIFKDTTSHRLLEKIKNDKASNSR